VSCVGDAGVPTYKKSRRAIDDRPSDDAYIEMAGAVIGDSWTSHRTAMTSGSTAHQVSIFRSGSSKGASMEPSPISYVSRRFELHPPGVPGVLLSDDCRRSHCIGMRLLPAEHKSQRRTSIRPARPILGCERRQRRSSGQPGSALGLEPCGWRPFTSRHCDRSNMPFNAIERAARSLRGSGLLIGHAI